MVNAAVGGALTSSHWPGWEMCTHTGEGAMTGKAVRYLLGCLLPLSSRIEP